MRRDRLVIAVAVVGLVIAVALVAAVLVAARDSDRQPQASRPPSGPYRGSEPPGRNELAPFALASYRGGSVSSLQLRGKVVALMFLESKCKEACPIIAVQVARGVDLLTPAERRQLRAIAISTQPYDDTRQSVRRFLAGRHAIGRLDYLIGTEAELRPIWRRFHILSALDSGDADTHSASVHIYDRDGIWVSSLHPGIDLTPENFAHDVATALDSGA